MVRLPGDPSGLGTFGSLGHEESHPVPDVETVEGGMRTIVPVEVDVATILRRDESESLFREDPDDMAQELLVMHLGRPALPPLPVFETPARRVEGISKRYIDIGITFPGNGYFPSRNGEFKTDCEEISLSGVFLEPLDHDPATDDVCVIPGKSRCLLPDAVLQCRRRLHALKGDSERNVHPILLGSGFCLMS
jgi:hypothetical protein